MLQSTAARGLFCFFQFFVRSFSMPFPREGAALHPSQQRQDRGIRGQSHVSCIRDTTGSGMLRLQWQRQLSSLSSCWW